MFSNLSLNVTWFTSNNSLKTALKAGAQRFPGLHRDFSVSYNCLAGANPLTMPSVVLRVCAFYTRRTFEPPLDHSLK